MVYIENVILLILIYDNKRGNKNLWMAFAVTCSICFAIYNVGRDLKLGTFNLIRKKKLGQSLYKYYTPSSIKHLGKKTKIEFQSDFSDLHTSRTCCSALRPSLSNLPPMYSRYCIKYPCAFSFTSSTFSTN